MILLCLTPTAQAKMLITLLDVLPSFWWLNFFIRIVCQLSSEKQTVEGAQDCGVPSFYEGSFIVTWFPVYMGTHSSSYGSQSIYDGYEGLFHSCQDSFNMTASQLHLVSSLLMSPQKPSNIVPITMFPVYIRARAHLVPGSYYIKSQAICDSTRPVCE